MNPNDLRNQLLKFREELMQVKHIDPRSKQLLAEIMEDIKHLMEPPAATVMDADPDTAQPSLSHRLGKMAVQFEVDHPMLAESTLRLVDLLGKAGL